MIFHHLHHRMPIYRDCTLGEMMTIGAITLVVLVSTLALFTWLLLGYASMGAILALILLVHTTRYLLGRLERLKVGKPYGYYWHWGLQRLHRLPVMSSWLPMPFLEREGRWSIRRMI